MEIASDRELELLRKIEALIMENRIIMDYAAYHCAPHGAGSEHAGVIAARELFDGIKHLAKGTLTQAFKEAHDFFNLNPQARQ